MAAEDRSSVLRAEQFPTVRGEAAVGVAAVPAGDEAVRAGLLSFIWIKKIQNII